MDLGVINLKVAYAIRDFLVRILPYLLIALVMLVANLMVDQTKINLSMMQQIQKCGLYAIMGIVLLAAILAVFKKLDAKTAIFFMIAVGVVIRLTYVLYTDIDTRQYDVGFAYSNKTGNYPWSNWRGHMEYIYTIFSTGKLPPIQSIENCYQYYHPPLWHMVAASWMKLNETMGFEVLRNAQSIQFVTCFCSSSIMVIAYRIFSELGIKEKHSVWVMPLICFLPVFYIMGGCINNDMLMLMLSFISILYYVRWYRRGGWKDIIICGLTLGLSMMTKTSAVILAIPYGLFFIVRFIVNKNDTNTVLRLKIFGQYVVFAIVSIPIGIWYPIRNLIKYDQPLNYVLRFSDTHTLYCGDSSIIDRFFKFPFNQFTDFIYANSSRDYNIWAYMFKTSLFEEYYTYGNVDTLAKVLFIAVVALGLLAFCAMIYMICKSVKSIIVNKTVYSLDHLSLFFAVMWIAVLVSYIVFNVSYPFGCTMDVRYIIPAVFATVVLLGMFMRTKEKCLESGILEMAKAFYDILIIVFSSCSILFYLFFVQLA